MSEGKSGRQEDKQNWSGRSKKKEKKKRGENQ